MRKYNQIRSIFAAAPRPLAAPGPGYTPVPSHRSPGARLAEKVLAAANPQRSSAAPETQGLRRRRGPGTPRGHRPAPVRGAHLLLADGVGQEAGAVSAVRGQDRAEGADAALTVLAEQLQQPPRVDAARPHPLRGRSPRQPPRHGARGAGREPGRGPGGAGGRGRRASPGKRCLRVGRREAYRPQVRTGAAARGRRPRPASCPPERAAGPGRPASPPRRSGGLSPGQRLVPGSKCWRELRRGAGAHGGREGRRRGSCTGPQPPLPATRVGTSFVGFQLRR